MISTNRSMQAGRGLRRPRAPGFLAAAALLAGLTYIGAAMRPGVPVDPSPGDAARIGVPGGAAAALAPGSLAQIDRSIEIWAANLAAEPRDFLSATTLAALYHSRGRLTGDLADQERALEAARTAVRGAPTEPGARDLEASIRYTLHDFPGALATAEALYRDDPTQLGALATMADAKLELGRLDDARADYEVLATKAAGPALDIRLARLAYLTDGIEEALRLSHAARDAARAQALAGETADLGFYEYAAGEYARLAGDTASARAGFEAALTLRDNDIGALVGLARIDAFEGHTGEAIAALEKAAAVAPQPETLALLGDVLAAAGDAAGAERQFETVRFIGRLGEIGSSVFDRVLLRFELDHGGASEAVLAAARASVADRPDGAGHDTVAWALYRLGRFDEAASEIAAVVAHGGSDARLLFHGGAVALARGDTVGGQALLDQALAFGPALDPIERAESERLLTR
jgi:tetratricopeptide (TPR) repeat protein